MHELDHRRTTKPIALSLFHTSPALSTRLPRPLFGIAVSDGILWYPDFESALRIALQLGAAVGAGIVLARRSAKPTATPSCSRGLIVDGLPEVTYQMRFPEQGSKQPRGSGASRWRCS